MSRRTLRLAVFTLFCGVLVGLIIIITADLAGKISLANWNDDFNLPSLLLILFILLLPILIILLIWLNRGQIFRDVFHLMVYVWSLFQINRDAPIALTYIQQAIRMNAPLSPFLLAASRSERGRLGRQLRELQELLNAGVDLSIALQQSIPSISPRAIGLIAAGEQTGQLSPVLARLIAESQTTSPSEKNDTRFIIIYIPIMLLLLTGIIAMLEIFVLPKFKDIYHDFHLQVPPLTEFVFSPNFASIAGIIALILISFWLAFAIWSLARHHRADRGPANFIAHLLSFIPWLGQSLRDRALADVCRVLSDSLIAGQPAEESLAQAQQLSLPPTIHSTLDRWSDQIFAGTTLGEGARRAGLPTLFVGILTAAGDSPAPALDFLERYYANRFSRLRIVLGSAILPAVVLFFAACVSVIAFSLFIPMTEMINHLSNAVYTIK